MSNEPDLPGGDVIDPGVECGVSTGPAGPYYSDRRASRGQPERSPTSALTSFDGARQGKPTVDPLESRGDLQIAIPTHSPLLG